MSMTVSARRSWYKKPWGNGSLHAHGRVSKAKRAQRRRARRSARAAVRRGLYDQIPFVRAVTAWELL